MRAEYRRARGLAWFLAASLQVFGLILSGVLVLLLFPVRSSRRPRLGLR